MTREPLTLASGSPRRRQLLEMLGIAVRVVPSNVPEVRRPTETPLDYVERLAREKGLSVPGRLVLGADTTRCWRSRWTTPTRSGCWASSRAARIRW